MLENSLGKTPRVMVSNIPNKDILVEMLKEGEKCYAGTRQNKKYFLPQSNNKASEDYRNNEQTLSHSIINENNTKYHI